MDHRTLSKLIIRLAGLIILVNALLAVPGTIVELAGTPYPDQLIGPAIFAGMAVLLPVVAGLAMVWLPGTIGNRITCIQGGETIESTEPPELEQTALSVLGLYFIAVSLIDAVYWVARARLYAAFIAAPPVHPDAPPLLPEDFAGMVANAAQLLIGLGVVLGRRGLAKLLVRLRS